MPEATRQKAEVARAKSAKCQKGEQNGRAKYWAIRGLDGTVYEFYNLLHWLREHADLLDGTPEQARTGFIRIKSSLQGKSSHPCFQWKWWTLVAYESDSGEIVMVADLEKK
jgi:hypothetical protein